MITTPVPFASNLLPTTHDHSLYWAQYGNPQGPAIVVLHGGPGSHSRPEQALTYDLNRYQVILCDQRGCGRSLPAGDIAHNTLDDLLGDLEGLRQHLGLARWWVAGGSWGSTLALAYAETFPQVVRGLLLSSVFLASPDDQDWAFTQATGVARCFPDLWEKYLDFLQQFAATPATAATTLLAAMQNGSAATIRTITAGVQNWENNLMNAHNDVRLHTADDVEESDIATVRVALHYAAHQYFLAPNQLLDNAFTIAHLPTIIVHGRYDLLCPLTNSWQLVAKIPQAQLVILPTSNHALTAEGKLARQLAFNHFLSQQEYNE